MINLVFIRTLLVLGDFHGRETCLRTLGSGADILLVVRVALKQVVETKIISLSVFFKVTVLGITFME